MANNHDTSLLARPLYSTASKAAASCPPLAHAGLWYDKFCHCWNDAAWKRGERPNWNKPEVQKADWIRTIVNRSLAGDAAVLNEFAKRQESLVKAMQGKCLRLQTESRFVTGLGREHPVENGFAWHSMLGTPYLPGSGIKGLVRAWGAEWGGALEELLTEVLGSQTRDQSRTEQAGSVIFFDAIPLAPVKLEIDVMTPHYSEYYQEGKPPGDWMNPTPIPFLVVAQGMPFQFSFAPRTSIGKGHMEIVETWLRESLQWLGAGAKSAIGYGRFETGKLKVNSPVTTSTAANRPRYERGDIVTVTRTEDPKPKAGKQRTWFVADDGFGGVIAGGDIPDVEIGASTQLEIAAVMQHGGYNFRLPKRNRG